MTHEEVDAMRSVYEMAELYDWRIPMIWSPALVKHMFYEQFGREMTDQEWDIFANGDIWNSGIIMAGAVAENKIIIEAMNDAVEDAENARAFDEITKIYLINDKVIFADLRERLFSHSKASGSKDSNSKGES